MELSSSMYGCLLMFLLIQCVRYSSMNSYTHLQWNICGTSERRTVSGSNLTECIRFCAMRGYCVSISYNRKYGVCKLYDSVAIQSQNCLGYVFVRKEHFKLAENNKYLEMNCLPDQVSEDTCVYRECGPIPTVQGAETLGNMMHVGAKVQYVCEHDGSVSYIECGKDGQWSSLPECLGGCGLFRVNNVITTQTADVIEFSCSEGRMLYPPGSPSTIKCLPNGSWEYVNPDTSCKTRVTTIGKVCNDDRDCHDMHSRCLRPAVLDDYRCYCNVMYEFDDQTGACVQECVSYSKDYSERSSSQVSKHIIFTKHGIDTPDPCAEFCFKEYDKECPAFIIDLSTGWCKCLSVTFQQVETSNPVYTSSNYNRYSKMYDRLCTN